MEEIQTFKDFFKRKIIDLSREKTGRLKTPMDMALLILRAYKILPTPLIALDLFSRNGLGVTADFAPRCDYLEMWEINPKYAKFAKIFFPKAIVKIGDSIKATKEGKLLRKDYNFIVMDNSLGIFDETLGYCEHFNFFPEIFNYIDNKGAIFVMNVVTNVEEVIGGQDSFTRLDNWLKKRRNFYNKDANFRKTNPEELEEIYKNKFTDWGIKTKKIFYIPRNSFVGFLIIVVEK